MDDPKSPKDNSNAPDRSQKPDDPSRFDPFVAFRRYADDQVSALVNTLVGLPATFRDHAPAAANDDKEVASGSVDVWSKEWSTSKRDGDNDDEKDVARTPKWSKSWSFGGKKVEPEVIEDKDGNKTYHWSGSWSWPPKDDDRKAQEDADKEDARQRDALQEARRRADEELEQMSELFKSWFGPDNPEEEKRPSRGRNLLDWIWPDNNESDSPHRKQDIVQDMEDRIKQLESEFRGVHNSFWGPRRGDGKENDQDRETDSFPWDAFRHPFTSLSRLHSALPPNQVEDRLLWLHSHPYSPVRLEAEAEEQGVDSPAYIDAFNDLMAVTQGRRPMGWHSMWVSPGFSFARNAYVYAHLYDTHPWTREFWQNVEEGGEWHVPKKQLKIEDNSNSNQTEHRYPGVRESDYPTSSRGNGSSSSTNAQDRAASDDAPQTELDMYERFLDSPNTHPPQAPSGGDAPPSTPPSSTPQQQQPASTNTGIVNPANSRILSTLTTTERNTAPDGTVTTRVVLKKRFADGREECSETVNTARGDGSGSLGGGGGENNNGSGSAAVADYDGERAAQNGSRGGWFWSR
ncbi:uncharacterized protein K452DRAFT_288899 [Aplosporella prunicola CBS 121167]|uniref:Uncharacterized protein n=1 Tax=Aplosporella prunicola CBS 121167 TaxID=1176127 RepID=A0A6A6B979_9PEZI|nr:uncharacterized protein K452DRAFT_288899 [Aplosporella prunicola CBS 121167]KAF2140128.1 hypothetical protein K452DRAFT_288899 [Aplosporella prunicola CBS 121167]